jgi:SAM-dependent methyltransferase
VAISNCVVNYAADKAATFKELFRCLRPGGRALVSDLLVEGESSQEALQDPLWGDWLAHASGKREYLAALAAAGFRGVEVLAEGTFPMAEMDPRLRGRIVSIKLRARK